MIRKRLQHRPNWPDGTGYDPRLVITVEGLHDVYRLARHLETGQVEFAALGRRILRSLDEQDPGVVRHLTARMGTSRGGYRGRKRRQPQLRLGMTDDELAQLEVAVR